MANSNNHSNATNEQRLPDKQKYLRILENEGLNAALTTLHKDMWTLEFETFEGQKGYQPQLFEDLKLWRDFSLELWDKKFDSNIKP